MGSHLETPRLAVPLRILGNTVAEGPDRGRPVVILTENPEHWGSDQGFVEQVEGWPDIDDEWTRWSTGHRSYGIAPGDHAILLRQGRERGIVGIGRFTSECFRAPHWGEEKKEANSVGLRWECLVSLEDRIETEVLIESIREGPWNSLFASGVQAAPGAAERSRSCAVVGSVPTINWT